jgi:hypothetical protein
MKSDDSTSTPQLNRALPGWAVDAIVFGLPRREARDRRRLWAMCMKIAMSAHRRGWTEAEYCTEISANKHGGLWRQLTTRPDGRPRSEKSGYTVLWSAWESGLANVNNVGMRTKAEIAADAVELAYHWADRLTDALDDLDQIEVAVMSYVISESARRGYLRVTCPGREVAEFAKTSHRSAARVLARLAERGLLVRHSPGRRGTGSSRRAAIYGLADPKTIGT